MSAARMAALALALLAPARAADDPGSLLSPGPAERPWRPLLAAMASQGTVAAPFTERRYFAFRRAPLVLEGTLRISPEHGLSLAYERPEPSVVIADSAGLLVRGADGRARAVAAGSRGMDAVGALLPILRFDLAALYPRFRVRAFGSPAAWRLSFEPLDPEAAEALGSISVAGQGERVTHLEFLRSSARRIEIDVGPARTGAPFSGDELRRYFR